MATQGKSASPAIRGKLSKQELKAIDQAVGGQLRMRRILLGLSQEAVSKIIDLTFQQLQKYEHGTNRISASRLYQLGLILHVPPAFFFETVEALEEVAQSEIEAQKLTEADDVATDVMGKRKTIELVKAFYAIEDAGQRNAALQLLKAMSQSKAA